jgi:hypothetical protein
LNRLLKRRDRVTKEPKTFIAEVAQKATNRFSQMVVIDAGRTQNGAANGAPPVLVRDHSRVIG